MSEEADVTLDTIYAMVYEEKRKETFPSHQWPYMEDCNCTPDKMANAGFYWCGSDSQPDQVRCFVCLKEVEDWDMDDNPMEEHKRLCPNCPFIQLGKPQDELNVKQVMELCQKSLIKYMDINGRKKADEYSAKAHQVRKILESLGEQQQLDG